MIQGGETKDFLQLMLDCITNIEEDIHGSGRDEFLASRIMQDAVIRRLIIIGECIKSVPRRMKDDYYTIEWRSVVGIRDILVHDYWGVDHALVWKMVTEYLPTLKIQMLLMVKNIS